MFNSTFLQTKNNNMNISTKTTTTSCVLSSQTKISLLKKFTFLLAFIAVTLGWQISAQTVIIGAQTGNTTSTGSDPIDGYYASFRYQVVYTAA